MTDNNHQQNFRLQQAEDALAALQPHEIDTILSRWSQWTHEAPFPNAGKQEEILSKAWNPEGRNHAEILLRKVNSRPENSGVKRTVELEAKNKELESLNRTIQRLSRMTQEAMENDRRHIAKELHDSIGAGLAAIKFGIEQRLVDMDKAPDTSNISFENILMQIKATIKEIKRISQDLRPSTLDELGLRITLESHVKALAEVYPNIEFNTQLEVMEEQVPETVQIVLYRVLQEALNNVCRHSGTNKAFVRLTSDKDYLWFEIWDSGKGFILSETARQIDPTAGYGMQSMRDRVEVSGGQFKINSSPGQGTRIQVRFPCHRS